LGYNTEQSTLLTLIWMILNASSKGVGILWSKISAGCAPEEIGRFCELSKVGTETFLNRLSIYLGITINDNGRIYSYIKNPRFIIELICAGGIYKATISADVADAVFNGYTILEQNGLKVATQARSQKILFTKWPFGMENHTGIACWFNAFLQMFITVPELLDCLNLDNSQSPIAIALQEFLIDPVDTTTNMAKTSTRLKLYDTVVNLHDFAGHKYFPAGMQHDAHEAFTIVLEQLGEHVNNLFAISTKVTLCCASCGYEREGDKIRNPLYACNIAGGLEQYLGTNVERIANFKCVDRCGETCDVIRTTAYTFPKYVMLYAAHFDDAILKFVATSVKYPTEIVQNGRRYSVVATCEKSGGAGGGHWYTRALRTVNGRAEFLCLNDRRFDELTTSTPKDTTRLILYRTA
jgi:ubiquitin C-terminal hydrolase